MSALATRLLVLGVVRLFEPANAYQLRRELLGWQVDRWANLGPGSIYGMLGTLDKTGLVRRHRLTGVNGGPVAVYETTPEGAARFPALIEHGIRHVGDWADLVDLRAALSFVPYLTREALAGAVDARIVALGAVIDELHEVRAQGERTGSVPPHVLVAFGLDRGVAEQQLAWLHEYRARLRAGELLLAGERGAGWEPPAEDAGHAMRRDRAHYLHQLRASP